MGELAELQRRITEERAARGFTTDPVRLLTLLVEELGEVARELKKTWSPNYPAPDPAAVRDELADVMMYLVRLANVLGVDLDEAVQHKLRLNGQKYPVDKARNTSKKYDQL